MAARSRSNGFVIYTVETPTFPPSKPWGSDEEVIHESGRRLFFFLSRPPWLGERKCVMKKSLSPSHSGLWPGFVREWDTSFPASDLLLPSGKLARKGSEKNGQGPPFFFFPVTAQTKGAVRIFTLQPFPPGRSGIGASGRSPPPQQFLPPLSGPPGPPDPLSLKAVNGSAEIRLL